MFMEILKYDKSRIIIFVTVKEWIKKLKSKMKNNLKYK
jgi:hypothetical protein